MKNKQLLFTISLILTLTSAGCAYRYYLGLHGPSRNNFPDAHLEGMTEDSQCLGCHAPGTASDAIPATTHPSFKGCLKCHNDPV